MLVKKEVPSNGDERIQNQEFEVITNPDIIHELAILKITDPNVLIDNLLRYVRKHPDTESQFVEPMIEITSKLYGGR